jgi:hypothetical protein
VKRNPTFRRSLFICLSADRLLFSLNLDSWFFSVNPTYRKGLSLSQRLLTPILRVIDVEIKHLIFVSDRALYTLPIGNLPVGKETRLFQKVGFLGACLSDRFVCTYLSTLRGLLTHPDRPNLSLNPSTLYFIHE